MRPIAVTALAVMALAAAGAQAADTKAPRHPISEGKPISEVVPPKPAADLPEGTKPITPREPVERSTRQPTRPERIQPNPPPEPTKPIETIRPQIRKSEPPSSARF